MKEQKLFLIEPNCKISQVQREFNHIFPYLKLEFFKYFHTIHGTSPKKDLISADQPLKLKGKTVGPLAITEDTSVSTLEQIFKDYFGLSAQVFRKSGRSWLETSLTDDWTLKRQNDEGFELSSIA